MGQHQFRAAIIEGLKMARVDKDLKDPDVDDEKRTDKDDVDLDLNTDSGEEDDQYEDHPKHDPY